MSEVYGVQAHRLSQARHREAHKARTITTEIREWIATLIRQKLSPEQVVGYLQRHKHLAWIGMICPLTTWEMALRAKAGDATYSGSFIAHWL